MIKVIIFAVVGLVLGLGGGSGFAVMRAKKAAAVAHDSVAVKGDSATRHEGEGEKPHAEPGGEQTAVAAAPADSSTSLAHAPALKPDSVATTAPVPTHGGTAAAVPSGPMAFP